MAGEPSVNSLIAQKLLFTPKQQESLRDYQNQQATSQALLADGLKPIDTSNRQIGGVGYAISPMEGVNKIVRALAGSYGQNQANQSLSDALAGPSSTNADGSQPTGVQGLNLPPGAGLNLDAASKAMYDNYYADHRPGATYRDASGNVQTAPTDLQINTGTGPAQQAPPIAPVQGPQDLPPPMQGQQGMPPSLSGPPPSPSAVTGAATPMASPVNMSAAPGGGPRPNPPPSLAPMPGESPIAYQTRIKPLEAGATTTATDTAKNSVDAEKSTAQMLTRLVPAMQKAKQMADMAPQTMSGYGVVGDQPPGSTAPDMGWRLEAGNALGTKKATATNAFQNLNDQLFLNEIPALTSSASAMRLDIPIVKGIKNASGVSPEYNTATKQQIIKQLQDNFGQTKQAVLENYQANTGKPYDFGKIFTNPDQVGQAYSAGMLTKEEAANLLQNNHGFGQ